MGLWYRFYSLSWYLQRLFSIYESKHDASSHTHSHMAVVLVEGDIVHGHRGGTNGEVADNPSGLGAVPRLNDPLALTQLD